MKVGEYKSSRKNLKRSRRICPKSRPDPIDLLYLYSSYYPDLFNAKLSCAFAGSEATKKASAAATRYPAQMYLLL